ncbi:hypothetical protein [Demequina maris]|uniref:hypothetical protein n=1 Tax=Demequina maris TaxID=1638982 RepID=UPI0007848B96|nr:hypothetical protein [Demequina maris]
MGLTVGDLRAILVRLPDDAEIRLAHQPRRPMVAPVGAAVVIDRDQQVPVLMLGAALDAEVPLVAEIAGRLW